MHMGAVGMRFAATPHCNWRCTCEDLGGGVGGIEHACLPEHAFALAASGQPLRGHVFVGGTACIGFFYRQTGFILPSSRSCTWVELVVEAGTKVRESFHGVVDTWTGEDNDCCMFD